jgi:hypothetical protein
MPSQNGIGEFCQTKEAAATRTKDVLRDLRIGLQEPRRHEALAVLPATLAGTGAVVPPNGPVVRPLSETIAPPVSLSTRESRHLSE